MTMPQRSYDLPDLIVNLQNGQVQALPQASPIFAGAQTSANAFDGAAISTTGVSVYYCGTGPIGGGTIWCGFWVCNDVVSPPMGLIFPLTFPLTWGH